MHQFPSLKCNVLLGGQSSFQSCGQVLAKACICCCLLSLANRPMASARHNLEGLPNDMKLDCCFGSTDFSNHINLQKKVRLQSKPKQSFLFLKVFLLDAGVPITYRWPVIALTALTIDVRLLPSIIPSHILGSLSCWIGREVQVLQTC